MPAEMAPGLSEGGPRAEPMGPCHPASGRPSLSPRHRVHAVGERMMRTLTLMDLEHDVGVGTIVPGYRNDDRRLRRRKDCSCAKRGPVFGVGHLRRKLLTCWPGGSRPG